MPCGLAHPGGSTLPLAGRTAWQALIRHGKLERRQRVSIYGHAGGVGTFAVQIARWLGAKVSVRRGKGRGAVPEPRS